MGMGSLPGCWTASGEMEAGRTCGATARGARAVFPLDIPQEFWQALLYATHRTVGDPARHARPDGAEDAGRHGTAARIRYRQANRAGRPGSAACQPGNHLSLPRASGEQALDFSRVGHVGEQSQGEVLFHYAY